jgi:hypothetical protein
MRPGDNRRSVPIYIGFTVAFSSIFYFLIAKAGHSAGALVNYVGCLMWCPGLAALVTCRYLVLRPLKSVLVVTELPTRILAAEIPVNAGMGHVHPAVPCARFAG